MLLASATALLAGCQTTPATGRERVGDVVAVPRTRAELTQDASHANLHAAVRAGVGPANARAQRLVLASCALPDPSSSNGAWLHTITPLLFGCGHAAGTGLAAGLAGAGRSLRQTADARAPAFRRRQRLTAGRAPRRGAGPSRHPLRLRRSDAVGLPSVIPARGQGNA